MRRSLHGLESRVDRLLARVQPSPHDWTPADALSDEELELEIIGLVEGQVGPAHAFATADAFVDASDVAFGPDREPGAFNDVLRDHWHRLRWLQEHAAHGSLAFARHWCVQPRPNGPWGPGVEVHCSCGASRSMLQALVPAAFQALIPKPDNNAG